MTTTFRRIRAWTFIAAVAASAVVLGLSGNFASLFLPKLHPDFIIFSLVVSSLTIVVLLLLTLRSQPRFDVFFAFILAVLWLTMGGWSVNIIGDVQCDELGGQTIPTKNGTMSYEQYCREMKVVQAFSWANFIIMIVALIILTVLTYRATSLGRHHAWGQSISDLPWFGEYPGYDSHNGGFTQYTPQGGYVVHQQPGHSVVIHQGQGGQPPSIQQLPGTVVSA